MAKEKNTILDDLKKPLLKTLLNSPLHSLVSENTLVVRCMGQKKGKRFSITAAYIKKENQLFILSKKSENCWVNMNNGANVEVILRGSHYEGWAESLHDKNRETALLKELLLANPSAREMIGYQDKENQSFDIDSVEGLQSEFGLIKIKI